MNDIDDNDDDWIPDWLMEAQKAERKEMLERYAGYCPDEKTEDFSVCACAIVSFPDAHAPNQNLKNDVKQGFSKTINQELDTLRNAISGLSPATRDLLIQREASQLIEMLTASGNDPDTANMSPRIGEIRFGEKSCIDKLKTLVAERHKGRRKNMERKYIAQASASLWLSHGGQITTKESSFGFVAFLERIAKDSGRNYDAFRMIKDYGLKDQIG